MPVERSHTLTTPDESLVIVVPSSACRLIDLIEAEAGSVESELAAARCVDGTPICQNLTDWSWDVEMREEGEENEREVMRLGPVSVLTGFGVEVVMFQK